MFGISCHMHFFHGGQWCQSGETADMDAAKEAMKVARAAGPELKMTSMDRNFNQPVIGSSKHITSNCWAPNVTPGVVKHLQVDESVKMTWPCIRLMRTILLQENWIRKD